jgi:hypothetical protein
MLCDYSTPYENSNEASPDKILSRECIVCQTLLSTTIATKLCKTVTSMGNYNVILKHSVFTNRERDNLYQAKNRFPRFNLFSFFI